MHAQTSTCIHNCICASTRARAHADTCVYCVRACSLTYYTHVAHTCIPMCTCVSTHARADANTFAYARARVHRHMHTHVIVVYTRFTCIHIGTCARMRFTAQTATEPATLLEHIAITISRRALSRLKRQTGQRQCSHSSRRACSQRRFLIRLRVAQTATETATPLEIL